MPLPKPRKPENQPKSPPVEEIESVEDLDIRLEALVIVHRQAVNREDIEERARVKDEINACLDRRLEIENEAA